MLIRLYAQEAIRKALIIVVIYFLFRGMYLIISKKGIFFRKELLYCATLTYIAILLDYTVLPNINFGFESNGKFYFIFNRWESGEVNLVPFKTIRTFLFQSENSQVSQWQEVCALNLWANVGLFVPYGILAWFYTWFQHSIKRILCTGVLFSVLIEIAQIFVQRGTDIDDVILNTLGVLIGSVIIEMCSKQFEKNTE